MLKARMDFRLKRVEMITIAIPAFNGASFLAATLKSVIEQSHPVNQIIITDDASTDDTSQLVRSLQEEYSQFDIRYYRNERNIGYPCNWNRCFEYCKTRYLVILHQDDLLKRNTVGVLFEFLRSNPDLALAGGYEDFIDVNGKIAGVKNPKLTKVYQAGEIFEFVTGHSSYIACSSVMFDMEKINNVGYFDTDVIGTDELYWPKVLSKYPIAVLGESLIYRRAHNEQTEYADFIKHEKNALAIYEKFKRIAEYERRVYLQQEILRILKRKFSKAWIGISANVAKRGYRIIAFKYIAKSIHLNPAILFYFPIMWKTLAKIFLFSIGIKNIK